MRTRKIPTLLIILLLVIGVLSGCSKPNTPNTATPTDPKKASFTNITPENAKKRLDSEKGIIVLDVRTPEEYASGHIKDSVLIPVDTLEQQAEAKLSKKDAVIFVYCRSGNRSTTAANILVKLGYTNVSNLGGIIDWPYEVVK